MDRYCFTSRDNVSGIRFILDRLTNDLPPTVSVDVHCAFDLDGDRPLEKIELDKKIRIFREIKEEFRHRWVGRAGELSFFPRDGGLFKQVRHDRYVRFDRTVCSIGVGVMVFGGASRYTTFQMTPIDEETLQHERRLGEGPYPPFLR